MKHIMQNAILTFYIL